MLINKLTKSRTDIDRIYPSSIFPTELKKFLKTLLIPVDPTLWVKFLQNRGQTNGLTNQWCSQNFQVKGGGILATECFQMMIFHGKQTYSHELMSCLNCSLAFNLSRNFTIWSDMPDAIGLIRKNNLQIFISNWMIL